MSEPIKLDAEVFSQLDDQQWRRLGVTQTFDRLLIEAVGTAPGPAAAILEGFRLCDRLPAHLPGQRYARGGEPLRQRTEQHIVRL